jgi:hypothetical protein
LGNKFPLMKTIDLLRQSAPGLASLMENAEGAKLRRMAAVVARAVVNRTGLSHPVIDQALEALEAAPLADADLQARAQTVAEGLDDEYFALKEPLEDREDAGKTDPQVSIAFSRARAASAVAAALGDDETEAAASAAYEAVSATGDSEYLTDAVKRALTI